MAIDHAAPSSRPLSWRPPGRLVGVCMRTSRRTPPTDGCGRARRPPTGSRRGARGPTPARDRPSLLHASAAASHVRRFSIGACMPSPDAAGGRRGEAERNPAHAWWWSHARQVPGPACSRIVCCFPSSRAWPLTHVVLLLLGSVLLAALSIYRRRDKKIARETCFSIRP